MLTLLAVYSIWNISFYFFIEAGALNSLSPLFVILLATLPNVSGVIAELFKCLNSGYDADSRLFLLTSLSPLISVGIYHLILSGLFTNHIERFMFASGMTVTLSFTVLCLLTFIVEYLNPNESNQ